ncbi:MAG: hypothetical protein GXP54_00925 [Deltaproteobacteria bacterium]|nr:hypothetical protein [Deltaproteobacteria bacterium]
MGKRTITGLSLTLSFLFVVATLLPGCGRGKSDDTPGFGSNNNGATSKLSFFGPTPGQFNFSKDVASGVITADVAEGVAQPDTVDSGFILFDVGNP